MHVLEKNVSVFQRNSNTYLFLYAKIMVQLADKILY